MSKSQESSALKSPDGLRDLVSAFSPNQTMWTILYPQNEYQVFCWELRMVIFFLIYEFHISAVVSILAISGICL